MHRPEPFQSASCVSTTGTEQGAPCTPELGTFPSTRRAPVNSLGAHHDETGVLLFCHPADHLRRTTRGRMDLWLESTLLCDQGQILESTSARFTVYVQRNSAGRS